MSSWEIDRDEEGFSLLEDIFNEMEDVRKTLQELSEDLGKDIQRLAKIPAHQWTEDDLICVDYYLDGVEGIQKHLKEFQKKHGW